MNVKISRAIMSCYDKSGLREFAGELVRLNPQAKIFSSSGTFAALQETAGKNVAEISEYTGFREMPSGLVKTLHPKVHSGILADTRDESQKRYLQENGIETFDLVAVNLYPFEKVVAEGRGFEESRQNIDIGGVSLIESAAKNFLRVTAVTDPSDYPTVIENMRRNGGGTDIETRLKLAKKALSHLHGYIGAIRDYFAGLNADDIKSLNPGAQK